MILKGFRMFFEDFWFSWSPNPLHDQCIRYWGKKIENFIFVSNGFKMILKGFSMCFKDFWSPNPPAKPVRQDPCRGGSSFAP